MNAMILAAGYGTRLHPLTLTLPKALVPLAGKPLLGIILERLAAAGFDQIAVNAHHFSIQIRAWLELHPLPGVQIHLSEEEEILGTGGGIKRMISLLGDDKPILVHNVDVLSALPLRSFYLSHARGRAVATLAVQARSTKRYLVFDSRGDLCGRAGVEDGEAELVRAPQGRLRYLAFNGIQVIEPALFVGQAEKEFSSVDLYLEAAREQSVRGWRMDAWYWRDLGKPVDLEAAEREIAAGLIRI